MAGDLDQAYRLFTTGVALITTRGSKGPNVMAAEWTFNVSYEPFLISVHVAPGEATHEAIEETGEFGVNIVAEEQVTAMGFAGHFSQHYTDKLSSALFRTYQARRISAPMVEGSLLNAECRLVQKIPMGDHTAFVGEVVDFRMDPSKAPVVLHRGAHHLGYRLRRPVAVAVAVTPMEAPLGATVKVEGELTAPLRAAKVVHVNLLDAAGEEVARASTKTDKSGYFAVNLELPVGSTGDYNLVARCRKVSGRARLHVT